MQLSLYTLSLYVEVHDLLVLLSIIRGDYDVDINDIEEAVEPRQTERGEYGITKARINKTNDNFFRRTKLLFNYVFRVAKLLLQIYFTENILEFFKNHYVEKNKCTWRVICRCRNCNILNKIKLIWTVNRVETQESYSKSCITTTTAYSPQ